MRPLKRVVLTGLMGSGKTTVGRLLAARLGWRFVDLDQLVAKAMGMSVTSIFRSLGEPVFRDLESAALRASLRGEGLVIASGGGVVLRADNRARMRRAAQVVYLKLPAQAAFKRLGHKGRAVRPLLGSQGAAAKLSALLKQRRAYYEQAGIRVSALGRPQAVAERIFKKLQ